MVNVKKYVFTQLSGSTALQTLIGSGQVVDMYPNEVTVFPLVVYIDSNQSDNEYADNKPETSRASVTVHVFTKTLTGFPTTTSIGIIIADIFKNLLWHCVSNSEVPDPIDSVRHRVMIFSRDLFPSDLT